MKGEALRSDAGKNGKSSNDSCFAVYVDRDSHCSHACSLSLSAVMEHARDRRVGTECTQTEAEALDWVNEKEEERGETGEDNT